ncbi:hypothetical protein [uncultured Sphingomonas sp.]|uniref:hypothetical protein n=1 Tax=uncultured Sphingomonas sp. TaxID=158754 RepID=UPI0035CBF46E
MSDVMTAGLVWPVMFLAATGHAQAAAPSRGEVVTQAAAARPTTRPSAAFPGGLPHARGREFETLDEYLAHLRDYAGPMDRPWYREVSPGLFRLETGNLRDGSAARHFTRDQLAKRFGFKQ